MDQARVGALHRRTVLLSEGSGGRYGSAPGDSRARSPHSLLSRDKWRRAQGSEQGYGAHEPTQHHALAKQTMNQAPYAWVGTGQDPC